MSEFDKRTKPESKPNNGDKTPHPPKIVRAHGALYEIMCSESMAKIERGVCTIHSATRKMYRTAHRLSNRIGIKVVESQSESIKIEILKLLKGNNTAQTKGVIIPLSRGVISQSKVEFEFKNARAIEVVAPSIEKRAFNGHINLIWLYLHGVKSIGDNAFSNCCHLRYVYISDSLEKIGSNIFDGCNSIVINYLGTKAQWDKIIKDNDWARGCNSIEVNCKDGIIVKKKLPKNKMSTKKKKRQRQLKKKK